LLLNVNRAHMKLFVSTRPASAFEFFDYEQDAGEQFLPG
jgi:hypothetical protein